MEAERLLEQHFVLHSPLIRERSEVGQVSQGFFDVVFVPEEHAKSLSSTHSSITDPRETDSRMLIQSYSLAVYLLEVHK